MAEKTVLEYWNKANVLKYEWEGLSIENTYDVNIKNALSFKVFDNQFGGGVATGVDISAATMNVIGAQVSMTTKANVPGKKLQKAFKTASKPFDWIEEKTALLCWDKTFGNNYICCNTATVCAGGGLSIMAPVTKVFSTTPGAGTGKGAVAGQLAVVGAMLVTVTAAIGIPAACAGENGTGAAISSAVVSAAPVLGLCLTGLAMNIKAGVHRAKRQNNGIHGETADLLVAALNNAEYSSTMGVEASGGTGSSKSSIKVSPTGAVSMKAPREIAMKFDDQPVSLKMTGSAIELKVGQGACSSVVINSSGINMKIGDTGAKLSVSNSAVNVTVGISSAEFTSKGVKVNNTKWENGKMIVGP